MKTKRQPLTKAEFLDYYGIDMPQNTVDRELLILSALAGLQSAPLAELNERINNIKQFIVDTRHITFIQLN